MKNITIFAAALTLFLFLFGCGSSQESTSSSGSGDGETCTSGYNLQVTVMDTFSGYKIQGATVCYSDVSYISNHNGGCGTTDSNGIVILHENSNFFENQTAYLFLTASGFLSKNAIQASFPTNCGGYSYATIMTNPL